VKDGKPLPALLDDRGQLLMYNSSPWLCAEILRQALGLKLCGDLSLRIGSRPHRDYQCVKLRNKNTYPDTNIEMWHLAGHYVNDGAAHMIRAWLAQHLPDVSDTFYVRVLAAQPPEDKQEDS
jgi:hypothetical protein